MTIPAVITLLTDQQEDRTARARSWLVPASIAEDVAQVFSAKYGPPLQDGQCSLLESAEAEKSSAVS